MQVFLLNRIFSGTTLQRFAAQIIELLLLPFECKSVNHSSHSQSLKVRNYLTSATFDLDFPGAFKDSLWLELFTKTGAKGTKRSTIMWSSCFLSCFKKCSVMHELQAVKNSSTTIGRFFMVLYGYDKRYGRMSKSFDSFLKPTCNTVPSSNTSKSLFDNCEDLSCHQKIMIAKCHVTHSKNKIAD